MARTSAIVHILYSLTFQGRPRPLPVWYAIWHPASRRSAYVHGCNNSPRPAFLAGRANPNRVRLGRRTCGLDQPIGSSLPISVAMPWMKAVPCLCGSIVHCTSPQAQWL